MGIMFLGEIFVEGRKERQWEELRAFHWLRFRLHHRNVVRPYFA
jgi:hypothetical protein